MAADPVSPPPPPLVPGPTALDPRSAVENRPLVLPWSTPGIPRARTSASQPAFPREREAREAVRNARCDPRWGLVFPGLGSLCTGRTAEGVFFLGLGAAELGTGLAVGIKDTFANPGALVPLLAFADLFTAASIEGTLRDQRAARLPYTPQESLTEMFAAPFSLDVLRQTDVWAGILGTFAIGLAYTQLFEGGLSTRHAFERPILFGRTVNTLPGTLAAGAIGAGLFSHVAVAEEVAFRGMLQSGLVRRWNDEDRGWLMGSLIFGLFHASNALFLPNDQRVDYIVKGVPFITIIGAYLGWTYRNHGYGLSAPIAVHFWYDFLIEAAGFVLDPKNSPLSMAIAW